MNTKCMILFFLAITCLSLGAYENGVIKPLIGFMEDARISERIYAEALLGLNDYENVNSSLFWLQGGYPINEKLEVGAAFGMLYYTFENDAVDDELGLSDIRISGKYNFMQEVTILSGGGYLTLPIGSEDVGQQNLNFGIWGSVRYPLNDQYEIASSLGLDFYETYNLKGEEEYDSSFNIKLGALATMSPMLTLIPELNLQSEGDYGLLSVGADYLIMEQGHLRGALGLGLDDGAPDFSLQVGFLKEF